MTKWQSGDIITDKRWDELNNVYPLYKKIEIAADSPSNSLSGDYTIIFDIQMSELLDLQSHGVICWFKGEENGHIYSMDSYSITTVGIDDTRVVIEGAK